MTPEQSHSGLLLAKRYQLGDVMGNGAISTIYHGQDTVLQRPIVVKAVPPEHISAYRHALQVTSGLTHPAIVATYDAILGDEWLFLVQEAVTARPLNIYLPNGIPSERSLDLSAQLARALAYAHSHNVIHGDLTPVAILVDRHATVRINNFALPTDTTYFISVANTLPDDGKDNNEIDQSSASLTPASDVRAIGLLLWQLLSAPLSEKSEAESELRSEKRAFRQDVPDEVRALVLRCVQPQHPHAIRDAESLTLALEMEAYALTSTRTARSESTPPALRAARQVVAHMASWSTEDTLGTAQRWPNSSPIGGAPTWQPNQIPRIASAGQPEHRAQMATEEPIGQPRIRLPSLSHDHGIDTVEYRQPAASTWPLQETTEPETLPATYATFHKRAKTRTYGLSMPLVLLLGLTLFLLAYLAGFFLVALLGGQ